MSRTIRQRRDRQRRAARRRTKLVLLAVVLAVLATAGGAYGTYDYLKGDDAEWPSIDNLQPQRIGQNSIVLSGDGKRMGVIQSDQNRTSIPFDAMGDWAPKATVAIEDRRFYSHNGVDPEGVARAFTTNIEAGSSKEGASTITQQVIRNLYKEITTEKTLSRKAKEATLAVQLERKPGWTKHKILETYLNLVFYGNNAYGIQAASQTYYNTFASKLTIDQAAMLAGLPQAPTDYDPFTNPKAARARRDQVLRAMRVQGDITPAQLTEALARPIKLTPGKAYKVRRLPYFFDYVEQELIGQFDAATVRQGGLKIRTTINPKLQTLAERAIKDTLSGDGPGAAIAVLDTKTGEIRAMASSESYAKSKFNRPAQARRQPGSTAKTWVLASFIREGINPDTQTYTSMPISVKYKGSTEWWKPKTYSGSYAGTMTIRHATLQSDNSVYAQMTLDISPEKVAETAHLMGIKSPLEDVWSIGLGSQVVTPLEQSNFYATIARGGIRWDPRAVAKVTTPGGTTLPLKYARPRRVLEDWQAGTLKSILRDNVLGGTGTGANLPNEEAAGKTGTTDDAKDAWFCGITPELTACVWLGYNIPTSMPGMTGGATPATIWRRFMEPAIDQVPDRDWFQVNGTPEWQPFTSTWRTNPSFDTAGGAAPTGDDGYYSNGNTGGGAETPATPEPAAPAPDAGTGGTGAGGDAGAGGAVGVDPAPAPTPPAGGGTPAPATPAPGTGGGGGAAVPPAAPQAIRRGR